MTVRDILMRAYPRSWRAEYGEELGAILGQARLTVGVVADVLAGAFRQHLRRDDPWKICGAFLFLWTVAGDLLNCHWFLLVLPPVFFITGAWTAVRDRSDALSAARAVGKAAILAVLPDVVTVLLAGPNPVQLQDGIICFRWGIYTSTILRPEWWEYFPSLASQVLPCIWVGCVGGLFGRFVNGVREGIRG